MKTTGFSNQTLDLSVAGLPVTSSSVHIMAANVAKRWDSPEETTDKTDSRRVKTRTISEQESLTGALVLVELN